MLISTMLGLNNEYFNYTLNIYFKFQQWPQSESSYAHGRPHEFHYL